MSSHSQISVKSWGQETIPAPVIPRIIKRYGMKKKEQPEVVNMTRTIKEMHLELYKKVKEVMMPVP